MTRQQKIEFITNFMTSMKEYALSKVSTMPENWDGHELRRFLADEFEQEVSQAMRPARGNTRLKAYKSDYCQL